VGVGHKDLGEVLLLKAQNRVGVSSRHFCSLGLVE
jgi:hypothetical protein